MTYGIPYQGSKSRIAEALIRVLPAGKRFVDLFGGGAAMTHIAALSGKYESVLYNDIQPNLVKLVQDAIAGKYNYDVFTPEFITRERFFAEKESDAYVKYVWSFSNNGRDYLFAEEIEGAKHSIHDYIVYGTKDEFMTANYPRAHLHGKTVKERREEWRRIVGRNELFLTEQIEQLERLQNMQQLQQIERLERLSYTPPLIEFSNISYEEYDHKDGDIVYCDPPYENAREYVGGFDHKAFYDWLASRDFPVYFSSYDNIGDKRFTAIWAKTKRNLMNGAMTKTADIRIETLYVNHPIDFRFNNYEYVVQKQKEKQMTIFGGEK